MRQLGDDAPTQDEMIQLLGQLHAADLLMTDVSPDALELFDRGRREARARRGARGPIRWRCAFRCAIPAASSTARAALAAAVGPAGAPLWLAVVVPALVLLPGALARADRQPVRPRAAADNLLLLALVFPVVKALHELGHATATRAAGGEVHDMGVMLLVLMPVPYVDASAARCCDRAGAGARSAPRA